jgi:hypothetical protein
MIGKRAWIVSAVVVGLAAGSWFWIEHVRIEVWWRVRQLVHADEQGRDDCVRRVAGLGGVAVPELLARLAADDNRICENMRAALLVFADQAAAHEEGAAQLADALAGQCGASSTVGTQVALEVDDHLLTAVLTNATPAGSLSVAIGRLLQQVADRGTTDNRARALALTQRLLANIGNVPVSACRDVVAACLTDEDSGIRLQAMRLAILPTLDMLDRVVPLLRDPIAEIRRAALLAVGPAPDLIGTDALLFWLHDPDMRTRRLCEIALRGRGLRDDQLRMGRLITDPHAKTRMHVLFCLGQGTDVEPTAWLRRLTCDPVAAVRAAAIRAAAEEPSVDLKEEIRQMAQNDPSPTVRQMARYYLACRN